MRCPYLSAGARNNRILMAFIHSGVLCCGVVHSSLWRDRHSQPTDGPDGGLQQHRQVCQLHQNQRKPGVPHHRDQRVRAGNILIDTFRWWRRAECLPLLTFWSTLFIYRDAYHNIEALDPEKLNVFRTVREVTGELAGRCHRGAILASIVFMSRCVGPLCVFIYFGSPSHPQALPHQGQSLPYKMNIRWVFRSPLSLSHLVPWGVPSLESCPPRSSVTHHIAEIWSVRRASLILQLGCATLVLGYTHFGQDVSKCLKHKNRIK